MRPILTMIRKEFLQVFRDPPMVALLFVVPLIQLFILAYTITTDVKHIRLAVVDYDRSASSREIVRKFTNTDRFQLMGYASSPRQVRQWMRAWRVQMALVIPSQFHQRLQRQLHPEIQVLVDGVDGNTAGISLGYAAEILTDYNRWIASRYAVKGEFSPQPRLQPIERMWYNLELDSKQFMVPGIVVVLLTIIPMMFASMGLVRERELGTLEQLMVTPLKRHQLLLGKIIPALILAYAEMGLVMVVAIYSFGIHMNGSYLLLAVLSLVYLFTTIGMGIFISTWTHSQQQAMFFSWFTMVFMILMGGFFIPIENMPRVMQELTYLNPMRYFMYILRDIFLKGSGIQYLWKDALILTVFGISMLSLGVAKFRKRIG